MRRLSFVLTLVLLAGCDAGDPEPARVVELEVPLADLALHVGETQEIDFAEHFRHSEGAALTFEAQRDSGTSVLVEPIEAGRVRLEARSEGRSVISVTAVAGSGLEANVAFAVDVAPGLCPPEPGPDHVDYFPMEAGRVWLFDYRRWSGPTDSEGGLSEGRVSMEFESVTCVNRMRTAHVREVTTVDDAVVRQRTRTFTEDSTNALRLELPGGYVYYDADPFEPDTFPRYAPASSPDTLEYGPGPASGNWLRIQREQGIATWGWGAYGPIWSESIRLDLVD